MNAINGHNQKFTAADGVKVRISPDHPEDDVDAQSDHEINRQLAIADEKFQEQHRGCVQASCRSGKTTAIHVHRDVGAIGGGSQGGAGRVLVADYERKQREHNAAQRFIAMASGISMLGECFGRAAAIATMMGGFSRGRSRRDYTTSFRDRVKQATSHEEVSGIVREAKASGVVGDTMRKLKAAASLRHRSLNEISLDKPACSA